MAPRTIAWSGALAVALAAPAAAQAAPTIQPLKPCYVTAGKSEAKRERVPIEAAGFTPNSQATVAIDGVPVPEGTQLQVGAMGELSFELSAPYVKRGSREFTITLTENGNPANAVSTATRTTALNVRLKPNEARPSDRIRFKGSGFTEDKAIWAHYLSKGTVGTTVRMARRPRGGCGGFKARRRQIPVDKPGLGNWTIQFDQSKEFVDPTAPPIVYVRLGIRIRLVRR